MAVQIPTNAFETIREVGEVASWVGPLIGGLATGGTVGAIWAGVKIVTWLWQRHQSNHSPASVPTSTAAAPFVLAGNFPQLEKDYSACYVNHIRAHGQDPRLVAKDLEAYVRCFQLLMSGDLLVTDVTAEQQQQVVIKMRQWIQRSFQDRHLQSIADPSNFNHSVFMAYLHKRAVELLGDGQFGTNFNALAVADAIRQQVAARFMDSVTQLSNVQA